MQKIYLGPTDKPAEVTALTGNDLPKPIITKGPELILMFATDELITDTGFNLYFEAGKLSGGLWIPSILRIIIKIVFVNNYDKDKVLHNFSTEPMNMTSTTSKPSTASSSSTAPTTTPQGET